MKKLLYFFLVLLSLFTIISCNKNEKNNNDVNEHEHVYIEGSCECGSKDPEYVENLGHIETQIEAVNFYTDYTKLSERGKSVIDLIQNATTNLDEGIETKGKNRQRNNDQTSRKTELENSGIVFSEYSYSPFDSFMTTFINNILILQQWAYSTEKIVKDNEYIIDYNGNYIVYSVDANQAIYYKLYTDAEGNIDNFDYLELSYDEQTDEYYYILLYSNNGNIMVNESNFKDYAISYLNNTITYLNRFEYEQIYDEEGDIIDLSHYGNNAWMHQYLKCSRTYTATDTTYYYEFALNLFEELKNDFKNYTLTSATIEDINESQKDLPEVNGAYYYLTNGYKDKIIKYEEINERPTMYIPGFEYGKYQYNVILHTKYKAVDFSLTELSINFNSSMNYQNGIHELLILLPYDVSFKVDYYVFNDNISYCGYLYSYAEYYGEDEKLSQLLEYFLHDDIILFQNADVIIDLIDSVNYKDFIDYKDQILEGFRLLVDDLSVLLENDTIN